MAIKISDFYSEYSIKSDKATIATKKIAKENSKLSKTLKTQTKDFDKNQDQINKNSKNIRKYTSETKKAERETSKFSRALKRIGGGARQGATTAGNVATGAAGGSLFASIGKAIPIAGALIIAAGIAIEKAAAAFQEAAKEQGRRAQFGRAAAVDVGLRAQREQLAASGFARADVEQALARLSETGISNISKEQLAVIQTEAKRVGTVTQAIENILSGKGFRSLGQTGKNIESIAQNLQFTSQSAQTDFAIITQNIRQLQATQSSAIQAQIKETELFRKSQTKATQLQTDDAARSVELASAVSNSTVNTFRNIQNDVAKFSSGAAADIAKFSFESIKSIRNLSNISKNVSLGAAPDTSKFKGEPIRPFANGGDFLANKPMLVGEKGPELRIPKKSGTIIPNNKLRGSGLNIGSLNITVNAPSGNSEDLKNMLQREIPSILNSYANKVLSRELGLSEGLG